MGGNADSPGLDRHRLRAPRPFASDVPRPHLDELAQRALGRPVVLVQADAGYGKTSFARLCASGHPTAWYCLDASDNDPQRFTAHLATSLDALLPGPRPGGGIAQSASWLELIDDLVDRLEAGLPEQAVVVIDDFHVIDEKQTLSAVAYFLAQLPAPLTAVVTTQQRPKLPGLHRWHAEGRLLTVGREELRFRADEVAPFFASRFGRDLTPVEVQAVHDRCEGWPIAMNLLGTALDAPGSVSRVEPARQLAELPRGRLAEYLREHVLAAHDQSTREFLLHTAVVDDFDQGLADALVAARTASVLARVEQSGLYLTSDGLGTYRYQGWFREFLRNEIDPPSALLAHERAAQYFEIRGRLEDAVLQHTAAGSLRAASGLLEKLAPVLISEGEHTRLLTLSAPLSPELRLRHPAVVLARADALRFASRFEESEREAEAVRGQACDTDDSDAAFRALEHLVQVQLDTVRPARAVKYLDEMDELLLSLGDGHRRRAVRLHAENDLNTGRLAQAAQHLEGVDPDPLLAARLQARLGNLHSALAHLRSAPGDGTRRAPRSHRERSALAAWVLALQGDSGSAHREALSGIETGRVLRSPIIECVCTGRAGLALLSSGGSDRLDEAFELLQSTLDLAAQIRLPRFRAEALMGLTIANGRRNNWSSARQHGLEALEVLGEAGDGYLAAMARLCIGIAGVLCSHPEAPQWLDAAHDASSTTGEHLIGAAAAVWLGQHHLMIGDPPAATRAATLALHLMREHSLDFLLTGPSWLTVQDPEQRLHIAELGLDDTGLRPYARYLADQNRTTAPPSTQHPEPWGLQVRVLGGFSVLVDGTPVLDGAWKRRKARELFWLLCVHPRHSVPRPEAADLLWPEGNVEPTSVRFRVALHALREALEPGRSSRASRFVHSNDERIWLDPLVTVDVDAYREAVDLTSGRDASPGAARRAVNLYAGPLLAGTAAPEWLDRWREELAQSWRAGAIMTAAQMVHEGGPAAAIPLLRAVLRESPYEDDAYRLLGNALVGTGQPAAARALHEECARRLAADLGASPSWSLADVGL
jgi:LuxR family maltose regulon positive regulatory protein